jgi:hypothetical protein
MAVAVVVAAAAAVVVVVGVVVVVSVAVLICRGRLLVRSETNKRGNVRINEHHVTIISSTHSECVSATLVIVGAVRMRRIILSPVWMYIMSPHLLTNGTIVGKNIC